MSDFEEKWASFVQRQVGTRYAKCRLGNFYCDAETPKDTAKRKAAIQRLSSLADNLDHAIKEGQNLIFYGPVGTGKDHLMVAMCRVAMKRRHKVHYVSGIDMYREYRDVIDSRERTERGLIRDYTDAGVLAISDPLPAGDSLSPREHEMLYSVIDYRYRHQLPTWATINVTHDGDFLAKAFTWAISRRLFEGAFWVHCDWGTP